MNIAILSGRLTQDPDLRYSQEGTAFASFTLAVDRVMSKEKKTEAEAAGRPTADFIRCKAIGKTAETIGNYLAKGRRASVQGQIQTGSYVNKEGVKIFTTDLMIDRVEIIDWGNEQAQTGRQKNYQSAREDYQTGETYTDDEGFIPCDDDSKIPF